MCQRVMREEGLILDQVSRRAFWRQGHFELRSSWEGRMSTLTQGRSVSGNNWQRISGGSELEPGRQPEAVVDKGGLEGDEVRKAASGPFFVN